MLTLHLISHKDGAGGASLLTDGFHAAKQLQRLNKSAYDTLRNTRLSYHASGNEGMSIQPTFGCPTLLHDPDSGQLAQVRWNNADRAGISGGFEQIDRWYEAARFVDKVALLSEFY